jgi:voltage-gated potassium channel
MNFAKLKSIIEETDTRAGRNFDLIIQSLIVVSLISFSVETLPGISYELRTWLRRIETICVVIFTIEYFLRILVADKKLKFITSFFGLVDLFAILPFYLAMGIDLRGIRSFRFLRLFRILKLARYSKAVQRYHRALLMIREEIVLYLSVSSIVIFLAATGIYYFEHQAQPEKFTSVFHSMWWAIATLTTVGYGDNVPITAGGKIFTAVILLIGLGIIAVPAGMLASALTKARQEETE